MMELDHVNIYVRDVIKSRNFYAKLLPPSGLPQNRDFGEVAVAFGSKNYSTLALVRQEEPVQPIHIAFRVDTRGEVDDLYAQALDAGGLDNGKPGPRPDYHEYYYAAFIRDLDGHNLEFVCHNNPR